MFSVSRLGASSVHLLPFEVVERKGLGHPDTISDLLADQFSYLYSKVCLERFGCILNHAVDKVVIMGAATKVRFGYFEVIEPLRVMLIGRIAIGIGNDRLPL